MVKIIDTSVCYYCGAKDETGRGYECPDLDMYPACPECMSGSLPMHISDGQEAKDRTEVPQTKISPSSPPPVKRSGSFLPMSDTAILAPVHGDSSDRISAELVDAHSDISPHGIFFKRCPRCEARIHEKHDGWRIEYTLTDFHYTFYQCDCGYVHIKSSGYTFDDPY